MAVIELIPPSDAELQKALYNSSSMTVSILYPGLSPGLHYVMLGVALDPAVVAADVNTLANLIDGTTFGVPTKTITAVAADRIFGTLETILLPDQDAWLTLEAVTSGTELETAFKNIRSNRKKLTPDNIKWAVLNCVLDLPMLVAQDDTDLEAAITALHALITATHRLVSGTIPITLAGAQIRVSTKVRIEDVEAP